MEIGYRISLIISFLRIFEFSRVKQIYSSICICYGNKSATIKTFLSISFHFNEFAILQLQIQVQKVQKISGGNVLKETRLDFFYCTPRVDETDEKGIEQEY